MAGQSLTDPSSGLLAESMRSGLAGIRGMCSPRGGLGLAVHTPGQAQAGAPTLQHPRGDWGHTRGSLMQASRGEPPGVSVALTEGCGVQEKLSGGFPGRPYGKGIWPRPSIGKAWLPGQRCVRRPGSHHGSCELSLNTEGWVALAFWRLMLAVPLVAFTASP